jgi:hypothetical protein
MFEDPRIKESLRHQAAVQLALGNLLVEKGICTYEELSRAIDRAVGQLDQHLAQKAEASCVDVG